VIVREGARIVAVVPARGGSKGVPRKNVRELAGRPLIAWTLDAVAEAGAPLRLVVTTDDDEIAAIARDRGAEVVNRPEELARDESPTEPAVLHALEAMTRPEGLSAVLLLQATSPVRRPGTLDRAVREFEASGADALVGVVESPPFLWRGPGAQPTALYDVAARPRRQDLLDAQRVYRETGSLYLTRIEAFRSTGNRLVGAIRLFVMREDEGADIDTEEDFLAVERAIRGTGA
jgi:N-acylneuraminate cytidylyltransferase